MRVIHTLHNYFLEENPKYMKGFEDLNYQAPVTIPKTFFKDDCIWMSRIHINEEVFEKLLKELGEIDEQDARECLRKTLKFMVLGGDDVDVHQGIMGVRYGLSKRYQGTMPLNKEIWAAVARTFEDRFNLPNCMGVFLAQRCSMLQNKFPDNVDKCVRVHAMLAHANGFIALETACTLPMTDGDDQLIAQAVNVALNDKFGFPVTKDRRNRYLFIGTDKMKSHHLLATPKDPGHFTAQQVRRGTELSDKISRVINERFGCIQVLKKKVDAMQSGHFMHAIARLHNFLLINSYTYGRALYPAMVNER